MSRNAISAVRPTNPIAEVVARGLLAEKKSLPPNPLRNIQGT